MPQRFHTTSTNELAHLAGQTVPPEAKPLVEADCRIQNLILRFNLGIEKAFVAGGMLDLRDCCTQVGLERMEAKYKGWRAQKISALNLVSCDFLSFDLTPDGTKARVFTFEKWIFTYEDGRKVPTAGSVDCYEVHRVQDRWRVDSVTFYAPQENPG
ncbi:MAG TPA: hypothetical protein PKW33_10580 [Anaerolineaceae bacterium]|nr:hypothetical protein [Anaerolineaceae bacterium]HPN52023.1 hypothetical protein [Anaerolineaceae bacterium]